MTPRVVIIDESSPSRVGYRLALEERGVEVVRAVPHDRLHEVSDDELRQATIALVNLGDPKPSEPFTDDFVGLGSVANLRLRSATATVFGYTSFAGHQGLRYRARRAGVKLLFSRTELEDSAQAPALPDIVLDPLLASPHATSWWAEHENISLHSLGVDKSADIESALRDAARLLSRKAESQLTTREKYVVRVGFAHEHRLQPRTVGGDESGQKSPGWEQISRFWNWGAKVNPPY